uniref:Phospholipase A(2) n=1 Tax=Acrobeloides nanus TaxID=290746 RepID=A0A914CL53_9BILA
MRASSCFIFIFFSLNLISFGLATFSCGSNRFQNWLGGIELDAACGPVIKDKFNYCCISHDTCYDQQLGKENCDNNFCNCLTNAAIGSPALCKEDAWLFCTMVKKFGSGPYQRAG